MRNRTAIGIICVILAVAITFVVSPFVTKVSEGKKEVVRFANNISQGSKITEKDIDTVELTKSGLPDKYITDKNEIIGKYANSDLYKGDIATLAKITDDANTSDNILSALSGDKVAMSVTISSFAKGLSGKLQNGDIVSIYVTDKEGKTTIPSELKYVRVITTTTKGGVDENEVIANEDGTFDLPTTITVLVSVKQAEKLANFEQNADMHVALVYRGEEKNAQKFIDSQDKYLKSNNGGKTNG